MRKYLNLGVKLFISFSILLFVFSKIDKNLLIESIKSASIPWVLLFIFVGFINNLICSYRWWYLNSQLLGIDVRFITFFKLYYIGNFFNLFLPSTIGGDSVKGYYIYKFTNNKSSIHAVIIDRVIGLIAVVIFGVVGLLLARIYSVKIHPLIYLLTSLIIFGLLSLVFVSFLFNKFQWKLFPKITNYIHNFLVDLSIIRNIEIKRIIPL